MFCDFLYICCALVDVHLFVYGCFFFFQAEDGIRDLVRSRGLGDVYKRQAPDPQGASEVLTSPLPSDGDLLARGLVALCDGRFLSLIHI